MSTLYTTHHHHFDFSPSVKAISRVMAGVLVLGLAIVAGQMRTRVEPPITNPQAFDSQRQTLFVSGQASGEVRVLHLRNNIGELAVLRAPARKQVLDVKLDPSRRWVWVLGDDAVYRYDATTFHAAGRFIPEAPGAVRFASVGSDTYSLQ